MGAAAAAGGAVSRMVRGVWRALLGRPYALPPALLGRYPELATVRWRRGGLPPRVGGWCLGQRTVAGITLGRTVFLADAAPLAPALLLHEAAHTRQFAGIRTFPVQYAWQSLRHGYANNRFEHEADAFAAAVLAERPPDAGGAPLAPPVPTRLAGGGGASPVADRST